MKTSQTLTVGAELGTDSSDEKKSRLKRVSASLLWKKERILLLCVVALATFVRWYRFPDRTPTFINYLPFSVPLIPGSRLAQVTGQSVLKDNLLFLISGFNDGQLK
jgi:hypothetical protein